MRIGYLDAQGRLAVDAQFDEGGLFSEGLAWVRRNGKVGFIDTRGRLVIPHRYQSADDISEGLALVNDGSRYGYIDPTGMLVIPLRFTFAGRFQEGLARVEVKDKVGVIDRLGRWVIGPVESKQPHLSLGGFSEGLAAFQAEGAAANSSSCGFLDRRGRIIVPWREDREWCQRFSGGLAAVRVRPLRARGPDWVLGKVGFLDRGGRIAISACFDWALRFSEGLAAVQKDGRWGHIDRQGRWVIPPQWDEARSFFDGIALVRRGKEARYLDRTGRVVWASPGTPPGGDPQVGPRRGEAKPSSPPPTRTQPHQAAILDWPAQAWPDACASIRQVMPPGVGSLPGARTARPCPKETEPHWLYPFPVDERCGFVDRCGRVAIPAKEELEECRTLRFRSDALRWADSPWRVACWIDARGRHIPSLGARQVRPFSEGLAAASNGKLWGFVDARGRWAISPRFYRAQDFREGLAAVILSRSDGSSKTGWVDRRGRFVRILAGEGSWTRSFSGGRAFVRTAQGVGIYDRSGRWILQPGTLKAVYGSTDHFSEGRAAVTDIAPPHGCGYIDRDGRMVIPTSPTRWDCGAFSEGLAPVHRRRAWVIPGGRHEAGGFLDPQGREAIPFCFDEVRPFDSGLAPARLGDRWGFVDRRGRWSLVPTYTDAEPFHDGVARVALDHEWRYIDTEGRTVWRPDPPPDTGSRVPFQTVLRPSLKCSLRTGLQPLKSADEWESFRAGRWRRLLGMEAGVELPRLSAPPDFGRVMLLAVSSYWPGCWPWEVRVTDVRDHGPDLTVHVEARRSSQRDCKQVKAEPLHVVSIPRTSKPIRLVWRYKEFCNESPTARSREGY